MFYTVQVLNNQLLITSKARGYLSSEGKALTAKGFAVLATL